MRFKLLLIAFIIPGLLAGQGLVPLDVTVYKYPAGVSGDSTCSQQRIMLHFGKRLWGFETSVDTLMFSLVDYKSNCLELEERTTGQHYSVKYAEGVDGIAWFISPDMRRRCAATLFIYRITSDRFCKRDNQTQYAAK